MKAPTAAIASDEAVVAPHSLPRDGLREGCAGDTGGRSDVPDREKPRRPTETSVTRRQVALAGHRGDERRAREGLTSPAPEVRATALGALARMRVLTPDDLLRASGDPAPRVRSRAAELTLSRPDSAVELLSKALEDDDVGVVEAGCFASGELGASGRPLVRALAKVAATHGDPLCREAAVAALGAIGDDQGLAAILAAMSDKPAVRRRAVLALSPFEGPDVDAALAAAALDRDWQVRQAAEDVTGRGSEGPAPPGRPESPGNRRGSAT